MHNLFTPRWITAIVMAAALTWPAAAMAQDASAGALDRWLEKQAGIHTWSADVVQIRDLPSLARPVETSGKDHLKTLALTRACIQAARTGQRVQMRAFYEEQGIPQAWL